MVPSIFILLVHSVRQLLVWLLVQAPFLFLSCFFLHIFLEAIWVKIAFTECRTSNMQPLQTLFLSSALNAFGTVAKPLFFTIPVVVEQL